MGSGNTSLFSRRFKKLTAFFLSFSLTLLNSFCSYAETPRGAVQLSRFPLVEEALSQTLPKDLAKLDLPAELGAIQEIYQGRSGRAVFYVQDAHTVYEAQKSIERTIDHLQKRYGLRLVSLEGGSGKLDPLLFRTYPDQNRLKKVFEEYLRKGELSGAAAAAVFNQSPGGYYGVEDRALYEEGILAFLRAQKVKPEVLDRLRAAGDRLEKKSGRAHV